MQDDKNTAFMRIDMEWPEIFDNPGLIETRKPALLCADGLCAWANCLCGNAPPENFGDVMVALGARIGLKEGATADNLSRFAKEQGWLSPPVNETAPEP